jgi:uncharacterized tellurite resistance protein B-like protein
MVIHDTFADFVLFLYIHFANSDNSYDPKELASIKGKIGNLFPEGTDLERKLYQAIREYNRFDRSKINDLCQESFKFFNDHSDTQKTKLFADVKSIMEADGRIDELEAEAFRKLKEIVEA